MVADAREGVVTAAVMDLAVPVSMAVVGWVEWETEFATEYMSKEVVVDAMGGDAAAYTYDEVGHGTA